MTTTYQNQKRLLVAVDCIIFGFDNEELKLLLIKRNFEPEKGKWSLMGGFLQEEETSAEAANRVLHSLTGLQDVYMEQVRTFSHPERDPVERTISIAYYALINIEDHNQELSKKHSAEWFSLSNAPQLIFDHGDMVTTAINLLRYKTSVQPIGFELLPEKFTMRQLQKLYEAILDQELDKRNFVKKINQLDVLTKLEEKDMTSSKKGSYLYQFDKEKYASESRGDFSLNI
ncbi:MAG: NUDIX domain-containing protein [Marinoscillum sp.]|uniref:NUDIX hydrolase n=1 Tax=Marinoscillum sp. TaxID=2024838 RepID=UPI0032FC138E